MRADQHDRSARPRAGATSQWRARLIVDIDGLQVPIVGRAHLVLNRRTVALARNKHTGAPAASRLPAFANSALESVSQYEKIAQPSCPVTLPVTPRG